MLLESGNGNPRNEALKDKVYKNLVSVWAQAILIRIVWTINDAIMNDPMFNAV